MVAGKVRKVTMPFHNNKSPTTLPSSTPPHSTPSKSSSLANKSSSFSLSLAAYFPRSSAQVQPRPPDVTDLLRLVDDLRDREYNLKTELLQLKLIKETAAIVPLLENDIVSRDTIIEFKNRKIDEMEEENDRLRKELDELKLELEQEKREGLRKMKALEDEIAKLTKMASDNGVKEMFLNDDVSSSQKLQGLMEVSVRSNLIKSLKKTASSHGTTENNKQVEVEVATVTDFKREVAESVTQLAESTHSVGLHAPRVPKPPPRRSSTMPHSQSSGGGCSNSAAPPPPPPPPRAVSKAAPPPPPPPLKGRKVATAKVVRVPEVVEFYHSLMKRESHHSRRDSSSVVAEVPATANARDMIGEIENRSSHLIAIKTDVETKGDFIRSLIKEVEGAAFTNIEDVVLFVKWLDDELSYLVDERAVLKHFNWPEQKADALREAAFAYCDLKKLESEAASSIRDDPRQPCGPALKKMQAVLEKLEHGVYNISRMRESATNRYKVFQIPVHWMLDNGFVSQLKLASVKLAMKYMKRVSSELETSGGGGPEDEELIVQGVRFAFRVHQFAGGFDVETMRAFQELRDKARSCHVQCQSQQQKFFCRSATC
ncbi:hypothetical protein RIF29_41244 [Crotalaria pallida]|uniref:Protein CHUP1, chloroplastic n=1 Tax=Crotalaria pallida TaxID=3830 RepID=A0AAN9HRF7_CROPI